MAMNKKQQAIRELYKNDEECRRFFGNPNAEQVDRIATNFQKISDALCEIGKEEVKDEMRNDFKDIRDHVDSLHEDVVGRFDVVSERFDMIVKTQESHGKQIERHNRRITDSENQTAILRDEIKQVDAVSRLAKIEASDAAESARKSVDIGIENQKSINKVQSTATDIAMHLMDGEKKPAPPKPSGLTNKQLMIIGAGGVITLAAIFEVIYTGKSTIIKLIFGGGA